MSKRTTRTTAKKLPKGSVKANRDKLPLVEHLHELRRRLFYVAVSVAVGSAIAYGLERKLIGVLLRPSQGQDFIYTSPLGGINFLFTVCLYVGLILSTPIIVYQLLAFMQPLMKQTTQRYLLLSSAAAGIVAVGGVVFGYYIGLPSALHFLLHQFVTVQVRPLITIQSYMSFVGLYLLGSALMFQLPLILTLINRIKPLKPSGLFKYERHLIVFAFIAAFIMNPTPNLIDQMVVVVPIIVMYQVGIALIWFINRKGGPHHIDRLRKQDRKRQAERAFMATQAVAIPPAALPIAPILPEVIPALDMLPLASAGTMYGSRSIAFRPDRPRQYANSFMPARRQLYSSSSTQLIQ